MKKVSGLSSFSIPLLVIEGDTVCWLFPRIHSPLDPLTKCTDHFFHEKGLVSVIPVRKHCKHCFQYAGALHSRTRNFRHKLNKTIGIRAALRCRFDSTAESVGRQLF